MSNAYYVIFNGIQLSLELYAGNEKDALEKAEKKYRVRPTDIIEVVEI